MVCETSALDSNDGPEEPLQESHDGDDEVRIKYSTMNENLMKNLIRIVEVPSHN